jgi:prenyltransferase beta subunit
LNFEDDFCSSTDSDSIHCGLSISELLESIDEFAFDNPKVWITEDKLEANKETIDKY